MKVIVIGAGVVGLATAWWLARDGHAVTVVDRETSVGRGASFANGGQLSYSYVAPMAAPGVLRSLPKWLLQPNSPIRFTPSTDPGQWRWIIGFLRACNLDASTLSTALLLRLSFHSREALHQMLARTPMQFHQACRGKLVIQSSSASQEAAERQMRLQATMGCEQQALSPSECLALEPALASVSARLVGGIYTPSDEAGDCRLFCEQLHGALATGEWGVKFALGTEISALCAERHRVAGLQTARGVLEADLYVLAAGAGSRRLGWPAGVRLNLQPVRGYSISARLRAPEAGGNRAPVRSITDTAHRTVYAPIGSTIRAAGFAELGGNTAIARPGRIDNLVRELDTIFPGACDLDEVEPWSGARPATPSGLPVIGRTRLDNLVVNLGHGPLGFTLAAGSASLLADLVAGREPPIPASPYGLSGVAA